MASDNLFAILDMVRAELPFEISDAAWTNFKTAIARQAGGERPYIPSQKKRSHLEALAELGEEADVQKISKALGVSVRRVQQLKRLLPPAVQATRSPVVAPTRNEETEFYCSSCWSWHKIESKVDHSSGKPICRPCIERFDRIMRRSEEARFAARKRAASYPIWIPPSELTPGE